ncbi:unnamed protein product [Chironomus riparius]|uniref:Kelch domain-containing protein 4 n=1 Tax=Chironomus riparius TaxID=315576 RepID=A0A9N9WZ36_9DIPT|nr:unnamed protein product [Chironomus riparius]
MGKKDKKKKKGFGIEKTNAKTDKKLQAKQKKLLQKLGEDDIENMVQSLQAQTQSEYSESVCAPPSPRSNLAVASLDDMIYFHGGEFFNGAKVECFGDLFSYNTNKNEWRVIKCSPCPTPRSGHQMISTAANGGELWIFGGEFASPSGLQFYHYRDLWKFSIAGKKWEHVKVPNGPSARSGHRMILHKKRIILFGGFHDNNQSFLYFNDVWMFSMDKYAWTKVDTDGIAPTPRSGVGLGVVSDDKIVVFGGYTKSSAKAGSERGQTHADTFILQETPGKWKWSSTKPGGRRPTPRSGVSCVTAPNGKIYIFGGVMDTEEDDENLRGLFTNEIHFLDIQGGGMAWRKVDLKKKKEVETEMSDEPAAAPSQNVKTTTDGIFTVTVAGPKQESSTSANTSQLDVGGPSPRMNAAIAVVRHNLWIFGGSYEQGSRQYTLCDFYSLDVNKCDAWRTHIGNLPSLQWLGSDSEDSSDSDKSDDDDDDDDSDDSEDESDMDTE